MNKKGFNKELLISIIGGLGVVGYIMFNTFAASLAGKDILYFLQITIIVPAIFLVAYGIYVGRKKTFMEALPKISIMTIIIFLASCISMVYLYQGGYVFTMLDNTSTSGNVVLDINSSITMGTVVQQILIFLVCACIGSSIGNKSSLILKKIKN